MSTINYNESICWGKASYDKIATLQNQVIRSDAENIELVLDISGKLGLTPAFLIAVFPKLAELYGKKLKIICSNTVYRKLINLDAIGYYNNENCDTKNPSFIRLKRQDEIIDLIFSILNDAPVFFSKDLQFEFCSKLSELYMNAFQHSKSEYIFAGKYNKNPKRFCFTCYDLGIGFGGSVNEFLGNDSKISDIDAIRWSLETGNSSSLEHVSRGIGLTLLKEFVIVNEGTMTIVSGKGVYSLKNGKETFSELKSPLSGTLFEMEIIADDKHRYVFK